MRSTGEIAAGCGIIAVLIGAAVAVLLWPGRDDRRPPETRAYTFDVICAPGKKGCDHWIVQADPGAPTFGRVDGARLRLRVCEFDGVQFYPREDGFCHAADARQGSDR